MTGTIQTAASMVITDIRHDALQISFVNDSGAALTPGQEVILKTDGTIDKRDAATEIPLGIVVVGADNGKRATIRTFFTAIIKAKAIGGTINAGTLVTPNGNKNATTHVPEYIVAVNSSVAVGLVVKGASQNGEIIVGIMDGLGNKMPGAASALAAYTSNPESSAYTTTGAAEDIASKADLNALRTATENLRAAYEDMRTKLAASGVLVAALAAYTADDESAAYTTTGATTDIASKTDLNALRVAYENLRTSYEDLVTKLTSSGIVS